MPPLTQESILSLLRLRAYTPPKTNYASMPLSRRAAVLLLLFPDIYGRLRVVLTLRSEHLRNFAGQVALPGGKADTLIETPEETARREAWEEIGLPLPNHNFFLPVPSSNPQEKEEKKKKQQQQIRFSITHLTELPCSLSRNNLAVRPVVAVLLPSSYSPTNIPPPTTPEEQINLTNLTHLNIPIDLESLLIPRLDPKEVSAVFSVPLEAFLKKEYNREYTHPPAPTSEKWYKGNLQSWYGKEWYMHEFMAPVWAHKNKFVTASTNAGTYNDKLLTPEEAATLGSKKEQEGGEEENELMHYRVWGMTARILVDAAVIAHEREPEFEFLERRGDEDMIKTLYEHGMLSEERKQGEEFVMQKIFKKGNL